MEMKPYVTNLPIVFSSQSSKLLPSQRIAAEAGGAGGAV